MITATIDFTKKKGRKKYNLVLSNQEDVQTVFQQFVLSLPIGVDTNELIARTFNGYELKDDEALTFQQTYINVIKLLSNNNNLINDINKLVLSTKNLNIKGSLIDSKDNVYAYLLDKPITIKKQEKIAQHTKTVDLNELPLELITLQQQVNDLQNLIALSKNQSPENDNEKDEATNEENTKIKEINKAYKKINKDFKRIEHNVSHLLTLYNDLRDGLKDIGNINEQAVENNFKLKTKLTEFQKEEKENKKLIKYFKENYGMYLTNDMNKIRFLIDFISNYNNPQIQKLANNSPENFYALIRAITKV